jgi:hypothetical protein
MVLEYQVLYATIATMVATNVLAYQAKSWRFYN